MLTTPPNYTSGFRVVILFQAEFQTTTGSKGSERVECSIWTYIPTYIKPSSLNSPTMGYIIALGMEMEKTRAAIVAFSFPD